MKRSIFTSDFVVTTRLEVISGLFSEPNCGHSDKQKRAGHNTERMMLKGLFSTMDG